MLTGIILFFLFIIGLLAIPVVLNFHVRRKEFFQGQLTFVWLFGLIRFSIPLTNARIASQNRLKTDNRPKKPRPRSWPLLMIRDRRFRRRILKYISAVWRGIQKRNLTLHFRLGLGDPADTGQLWALLGPLSAVAAHMKDVSLEVSPDFTGAVFELEGSGTVRVVPMQLLYLTIVLLISPPIWLEICKMQNRYGQRRFFNQFLRFCLMRSFKER